MSKLSPFVLESPASEEGSLLRSARSDSPGNGARLRTLVALGIGASLTAAPAAAASTAVASTAGGASGVVSAATGVAGANGGIAAAGTSATGATLGASAGAAAIVKLAAIVGVGAAVATGGWATFRGAGTDPPHVSAPAPPAHAAGEPRDDVRRRAESPIAPRGPDSSASPAAVSRSPDSSGPPAIMPHGAPVVPGAAPMQPSAAEPARGGTAAIGASDLERELAMLDRARRALGTHDTSRALDALDDFERRFPHPRLGPGAELLRVEALLRAGREADARAIADGLVASPAGAAYAQRLRSLFGEGGGIDGAP